MKKKLVLLASFVIIAGSSVLFALNRNNQSGCNSGCCAQKSCCTSQSCETECTCGEECTGESCECGCSCCK